MRSKLPSVRPFGPRTNTKYARPRPRPFGAFVRDPSRCPRTMGPLMKTAAERQTRTSLVSASRRTAVTAPSSVRRVSILRHRVVILLLAFVCTIQRTQTVTYRVRPTCPEAPRSGAVKNTTYVSDPISSAENRWRS